MVGHNGADARKERLQEIARFIQRKLFAEKEISLSATLTQIQYDFGLTEAKTVEYLRLIEKLGQFRIVEKEDKILKVTEGSKE
jgi:hypothetical protein